MRGRISGHRWGTGVVQRLAGRQAGVLAGLESQSIVVGLQPRPIISQAAAGLGIDTAAGAALTSHSLGGYSTIAISTRSVGAPSTTAAQASGRVGTRTIQNPGRISGNPQNLLVETGTPLKNRFGWRKRWYRMTVDDYNAFQRGIAERFHELGRRTEGWHKVGRDATPYLRDRMGEFRDNWLKYFLRNRKY